MREFMETFARWFAMTAMLIFFAFICVIVWVATLEAIHANAGRIAHLRLLITRLFGGE